MPATAGTGRAAAIAGGSRRPRLACSTAAARAWTTSAIRLSIERNIQKPSRPTRSARPRLSCACVLRMAPSSCRVQAKMSSGTTATSAKMTDAACCCAGGGQERRQGGGVAGLRTAAPSTGPYTATGPSYRLAPLQGTDQPAVRLGSHQPAQAHQAGRRAHAPAPVPRRLPVRGGRREVPVLRADHRPTAAASRRASTPPSPPAWACATRRSATGGRACGSICPTSWPTTRSAYTRRAWGPPGRRWCSAFSVFASPTPAPRPIPRRPRAGPRSGAVGWHGRFMTGHARVLKRLLQETALPVLLVKPPARMRFQLKVGEEIE